MVMNYVEAASACTRDDDPVCVVACPFHLDVRTLITRVRGGRFDSAYRLLRDALGFPEIALRLCPAPCDAVCERRASDASINLLALEQAAVRYAKKKEPLRLNVPPKPQRIAIVGGGLSGLGCALRLSSRGYSVTVYEQSDRLGGSLWARFPDGAFVEEFALQFKHTKCEFRMSTGITSLDSLQADAVYVATGSGGDAFGYERIYPAGNEPEAPGAGEGAGYGVYTGGGLCGVEGVYALAQGLGAANHIESFLKTGKRDVFSEIQNRRISRPDPALLVHTPAVLPAGDFYTPEEAALEAERCLQCNCDMCARRCPLVRHFKRFPDRIAEEVDGTVQPANLINLVSNRFATRLVASCDQCGICAEDCPEGVDLRSILADARREMQSKGDMPAAFSAFWLADMAHAEEYAFTIGAEGGHTSSLMFFPGCRLGAADPAYVSGTYERLRENYPDMALMADCCGAPAFWAGDMRLFAEKAAKLRRKWEALGSPTPVCACPGCAERLKEVFPGCDPISLYTLTLGDAKTIPVTTGVAVFDPCAARFDRQAQDGVRGLLEKAGFRLQPLAYEREDSLCCGWGGQYMITNPRMSRDAAARCAALSEAPYVTYCVNCRDTLKDAGKPALHVLDILLGLKNKDNERLTHSRQRENRELLQRMMTGVTAHQTEEQAPAFFLDDALREKISRSWLLEKDVFAAVLYCEKQKRKVYNEETGEFAGHLRLGDITYWVAYKPEGAGYRLLNAYAHRLKIDES